MSIVTAYSVKKTIEEALADIKKQFASVQPEMVIYFASPFFAPDVLARQMNAAFDKSEVFGCTTSGEIVSGKMLKQSIVAMAFDAAAIGDVAVEVIEDLKSGPRVKEAFASFENHYGISARAMDPQKYVGIILADGLSGAEEKLMDGIGNLTNVTVIGGSAGDDLKFAATHVFANGKAYTNAAVLALLKPVKKFDIIKTQSFCTLKKTLVATKVNEAAREVLEFNGKPAAQCYAEAVGVPVADAAKHFMHNPVGLMVGDEPYVRSPQQARGGSMVFYCNIRAGVELSLLESTDIIKDTRDAVEKKKRELGGISGILNFNCILRTLELEQKGLTDQYGKIFADIPTVGFSTYGEEYLGHINQTATMLVFK